MRIPFNGNYPITQKFGANPAAYAQFGLKGHNGLDYGLPSGTSVVAAQTGFMTVLSDPGGFGVYCVVDGSGYRTLYAHLIRATTSGNVREGQEIGKSGSTGNSTGPHLHFGVRPAVYNPNNGYNGYVDPEPLLKGDTSMIIRNTPEWRDRIRIINSEVAGWPFNDVHTGKFDASEMAAWEGKDFESQFLAEKWRGGEPFRNNRNTVLSGLTPVTETLYRKK